jgi:hypothetical protein
MISCDTFLYSCILDVAEMGSLNQACFKDPGHKLTEKKLGLAPL